MRPHFHRELVQIRSPRLRGVAVVVRGGAIESATQWLDKRVTHGDVVNLRPSPRLNESLARKVESIDR
jgi:hypothetical protein